MPYNLPVDLLIADDHQLISDGIREILKGEKLIGKIYTARNGKETVAKATIENIDCILMDISMPEMNGLEATIIIKKEKPEIKIIVVSMLCEPAVVNKMLKAGADAFINKETGKDELLTAIQKVMNKEVYISPDVAKNLFVHLDDKSVKSSSNEAHLTKRELEIIRLIADGLTDNEIAKKLFLSSVTANTHRKNILAKLQLKNTAMLIRYAAEHHLL